MQHRIVSQDEWLAARKAHLAAEKAFTKARDELSRQRRELPWVKVEKNYVFDTPAGKKTLSDLFEGRSQLIVYHFMLAPGWEQGCPSCSFLADHFDGANITSRPARRDVSVVSRAPLAEIETFRKRMGWRFPWVSSYGSDFNYDFHVSFTDAEMARGKVYYNYEVEEFPSQEDARRQRVLQGRGRRDLSHLFELRPRRSTCSSAPIISSTSRRRAATRIRCPGPCHWVRHHDRYGDAPHDNCGERARRLLPRRLTTANISEISGGDNDALRRRIHRAGSEEKPGRLQAHCEEGRQGLEGSRRASTITNASPTTSRSASGPRSRAA